MSDEDIQKSENSPAKKHPFQEFSHPPATTNSESVYIPPPEHVLDPHISTEQLTRNDLSIINGVFDVLYVGFGHVRSIGSLTRLVNATLQTIETRRKVLQKPYGDTSKGNSEAIPIPPLD